MLIIKITPNGKTVADQNSEAWAKNVIEGYKKLHLKSPNADKNIEIANGVLLLAFRALVKENYIDNKQVRISFKDEVVTIDKRGSLSHYPVGMDDISNDYLFRLLGWD